MNLYHNGRLIKLGPWKYWRAGIGSLLIVPIGLGFAWSTRRPDPIVIPQASSALVQAQKEKARLEYQAALSLEFDLSLVIVRAVDRRSREIVDPSEPEWRLIRTHEFCTYLLLSLIRAESGGQLVSGDNGRAIGPSQIWLTTARLYDPTITKEELMRPEKNVELMFRHFHARLKARNGNFAVVLYDWNRGPGTVDKLIKVGAKVENGYGAKIYKGAR